MYMHIRHANEQDAAGIANVHVNSWKTTYKGIVDDSFLENLSAADRRLALETCQYAGGRTTSGHCR
ncbi:hypothetical protein PAEVO_25570 [Paenibacillus sp. GM2FR]|nr:hypothetical protein PAEVO_25570 [Paenibacillus sp. GM2FR]